MPEPTLSELFDLDPLDLTNEHLDLIIADYRDKRHKYNLGDTRAGATKPRKAKVLSGAADSDLKDLLNESLKI